MKITIKSTEALNYSCSNEAKKKIKLSGNKNGVSPMESVLMAGASCSAVDIELILKKMRQPLVSIAATVEGQRAETEPKVFTNIHVHFTLQGKLKEEKVKEAIDMSVTKYCSVLNMLVKTATLTTSFDIIP